MDSPAMLAGIQQGDVITGFGERVIISFDVVYEFSTQYETRGDSVELTIMRQSQQEYKEMKIRHHINGVENRFDRKVLDNNMKFIKELKRRRQSI